MRTDVAYVTAWHGRELEGVLFQVQVRASVAAGHQNLPRGLSAAHEAGGGRFRASVEGELRAEGAGGHERDGLEAAQLFPGEGQVREDLGEGRQEEEVRRSFRRPRLYPRRPQVQEVLLSGGQRPLGESRPSFNLG